MKILLMTAPKVRRKAATFNRNAMGVTKIKRDGYATVNGFSKKNAWWEISAKVRARSKGMCEDSRHGRNKVPGKEVHHIIPLSKGGTTTLLNLIHLCGACHDLRHNHLYRARR